MRPADRVFDEWLVLRCQGGDDEALRTLVERWHPRLLRLARRLTLSDEAEEVVQEAWLGIVRGLNTLRDPARFGAWARRITVYKSRDWIRRRSRERRRDETFSDEANEGGLSPGNQPASGPASGQRHIDLTTLSADRRIILEMFYLEELSIREIAEVLSVPAGTVKSRLFHARQALKQSLEADDANETNR